VSDNSARLNLPYIAPSQAQKHVTVNEALQILDVLTQLSVVEIGALNPPSTPDAREVYVIGDTPTGDWAAHAGDLAYRSESGWLFIAPQAGWRAWDQTAERLSVFDGAAWVTSETVTQNTDGLGVQTTWDATNRLAVASNATLFSHAGAGHQMKVNKAAAADTASLLFQSDWTGHAEIGLAGETALSVKISDDGAAWQTALRFDAAAGEIDAGLPITGVAVQANATDVTPGRLMRADYGYGRGNLLGTVSQTAGTPTGAVIESGTTTDGAYTRWADGTQICQAVLELTFDAAGRLETTWSFPVGFATGSTPVTTTSLAGDSGITPAMDELLAPLALNSTAQNVTLRLHRISGGTNFQTGDRLAIQAMAMGRWF